MSNGFTKEIKQKVFGFWGHILIENFQNNETYDETPITENAKLLHNLEKLPEVRHISPFIQKAGIARTKKSMEGIILKGVDETYDKQFIQSYIKAGHFPYITRDSISREILISTNTAKRLEAQIGDAIIIYFLSKDGGKPIGRRFNISGFYHTGLEEYDIKFALGDLRVIQVLNHWDSLQVSGYEVKIYNLNNLDEITEKVYEMLPPEMNAESLKEIQPNIFDWLDLLVKNEYFALALMLIVALLNMTTALMILILDRTKMIGILKAIGATNYQIRKIFLYNALIILGYGLVFGNLIGLAVCWFQKTYGFIKLDESSYYFTQVPVIFDWIPIIGINLFTIAITFAVLIIPTLIISKISPIKAIRFD